MKSVILLLYFLICYTEVIIARSIPKKDSSMSLEKYLKTYGYLEPDDSENEGMPGKITSKEELTNAVMNLQKMMGLPMTGKPDDPNLQGIEHQTRCGVKDKKVGVDPFAPVDFELFGAKWEHTPVTWTILKFTNKMPEQDQTRIIGAALDLWHQSAGISFQQVDPSQNADILVSFGVYNHDQRCKSFDGPYGVLAHAFSPSPGIGGDAHFDDSDDWKENADKDLFTVAAHEFGHSLGIDHSTYRKALMFGTYQGYKPNLQLHFDDIAAIQSRYGPPKKGEPAPKPATIAPRQPQSPKDGQPPNPCTTNIDDMALLKGETYVFKDKWYWMMNRNGKINVKEPNLISSIWPDLPSGKSITAVTDLPSVDMVIFFVGSNFWVMKDKKLIQGFPREGKSITKLGIHYTIDGIDAAITWGLYNRIFLFKDAYYWKLSNKTEHMTYGKYIRVEPNYPQFISKWGGVPYPLDGAFNNEKGNAFFIKGTQAWQFNKYSLRVTPESPFDILRLLNCYPSSLSLTSVAPKFSSLPLPVLLLTLICNLYKF